jgi:hypothetical protein
MKNTRLLAGVLFLEEKKKEERGKRKNCKAEERSNLRRRNEERMRIKSYI